MKKQQALEDLFLAVRRHLLKSGRNSDTANFVATKVMKEAELLSVEDIVTTRNLFIA